MKKSISFLFVLFLTIELMSQNYSSVNDIKSYLTKNISNLDPIEGIWSSQLSVPSNSSVYGLGLDNQITEFAFINNGNGFSKYKIENEKAILLDAVNMMKTSSNSLYLVKVGGSSSYAKFSDKNNFKEEYINGGQLQYTTNYIKIFPDANSYTENENKLKKSSGTGFAISSDGYVITCNHVIDGATKIIIKGINGNFSNEYKATIALTDKNNDIAILKIELPYISNLGVIPFIIQTTTVDVGSSIYVMGYPLTATMGDEIKLTNGIISAKSGFKGDITSYQITAAVQPGNSGGPLFDNNGNIIGVVNAKHVQAENAAYAVKSNYLFNIIESLPTKPALSTLNILKGKTLTEQVKLIKNFVYIIEVN